MTTKIQPTNIDTTLNYSVNKLTVSGVDVLGYAQSAFLQANTVYNAANTLSPTDDYARLTANAAFAKANTGAGIKITSLTYPNSATAADANGSETITVTGSGFNTGANVYVDTTLCNTTYISATSLSFTSPAKTAAPYHLYVYNTDGSSVVSPSGIFYNNKPLWVTNAGSLLTGQSNSSYSTTVSATGTGISYSITSGTLPTGLSLNSSSGAITGTPTVSNTFNFTITATNTYNQTTARAFSIVIASAVPSSFLVIAGGGSGGTGYYGGGGGAGGYVESTSDLSPGVTYTITVGTGGVGTTNPLNRGGNGGNSSISGTGFTTVTAFGGGGGGSRNGSASGDPSNGANGGSGGGASFPNSLGGKGVYPGSSYISQTRQGYDGGTTGASDYGLGGGGGGGTQTINSVGGIGITSTITGSSLYYAGGGGGSYPPAPAIAGGQGGGGQTNGAGTANSGGGGGGGTGNGTQGGNGGSGVVIIKYADTFPAATTTGSPTVTSITGFRIYKFTGTGTFVVN